MSSTSSPVQVVVSSVVLIEPPTKVLQSGAQSSGLTPAMVIDALAAQPLSSKIVAGYVPAIKSLIQISTPSVNICELPSTNTV